MVGQQLPARRRGQQRAAQCLREHHAAPRSAAGIRGPDQQPDCGVRRVRWRRRQLEHPLGHEPVQGSLFEYYRDELLNARNFFAASKAPFNSNQFGGTFGGPLLRNKAFFFGDYQRLRQDQGRTVVTTVPTAEMRRGDLTAFGTPIFDPLTRQPFAGNIIPADRIDPVTRQVADIWPLPNRPGLADNNIENKRGRAGTGRIRHPR